MDGYNVVGYKINKYGSVSCLVENEAGNATPDTGFPQTTLPSADSTFPLALVGLVVLLD